MKKYLTFVLSLLLSAFYAVAQPAITATTKWSVFDGDNIWITDWATVNSSTTFIEAAQDAVGAMADANTLTYTDGTPLLEVKRQMSITADGSGLKLSGDAASPGNTQYYGTNAIGTKGWYSLGGTGITSLNLLTGAVQSFATGTAGSDFGISSSGSTHTFNLPSASASNRGALLSADWTTFNGKAASGANTDITSVYLNNTGLKIKDTDASHGLSIVPGSNMTADRTLTVTTGDASRTLTLTGDASITGTNTGDGQPLDATLTALAGLNTTAGLVVQTGTDAFTKRTITGTANEVSVADGDGASADPTVSLPAVIDLGGKTSFELPNSATPTVDAAGEMAVDVTVADFSHGLVKYFSGEEVTVLAVPTANLPTVDGKIVAYNATNDELEFVTPGAGGGAVATDAIWDAKGDLAVGTGANTAVRLAVGTDAKQIYADAAEATGLRWGPSTITPAKITSDQNNYAPTGWAKAQVVKISCDAEMRAITSFAATFDGDRKMLLNVGSYPYYLPGEHTNGTAANRITSGADYMVFPGKGAEIVYEGTSARWLILTPEQRLSPFRAAEYNYLPGSITAAELGEIGFIATGTGAGVGTAVSAAYPGALTLSTGTSATGTSVAYLSKIVVDQFGFGGMHIFHDALIQVPNLSDATDTYTIYVAIDVNANGGTFNNNSVGVRYTHGTNSGRFEGFSKNNGGTVSAVDLGVTVAANTLYKVRTEINNANTEVRFYIDGQMKGIITTSLPTANPCGTAVKIVKSVGTTPRLVYVSSMNSGFIFP